jgi:mRNA interferase YafQ
MLSIRTTDQFDQDVRRLNRQGKDLEELWAVVRMLRHGDNFDREAFRDHVLWGEWAGVRELHIRADWLLAYKVEDNELRLIRTGTHSDLFRSW